MNQSEASFANDSINLQVDSKDSKVKKQRANLGDDFLNDGHQVSKITNATSREGESNGATTPRLAFNTTHAASQVSFSHQTKAGQSSAFGVPQLGETKRDSVDEIRDRLQEMEAKEVRMHKSDFITFCSDALTQHKMENQGGNSPSDKEKHKVLQKVIDDAATLIKEEGRDPTVKEYARFISEEFRGDDDKRHRGAVN